MATTYPYRARATLKYKPPPGSTGGLVLAKGDELQVIGAEDEDGDYLRGHKADGTEGVFPEQFVERIDEEPQTDAPQPADAPSAPPVQAPVAAEPAPEPSAVAAVTPKAPSKPAASSSPAPTPRTQPASAPTAATGDGEDRPMSFKERLAAFNKPAAAAPPPVPRAKPAAFQRKPPMATPAPAPEAQTDVTPSPAPPPPAAATATGPVERTSGAPSSGGMSAADAATSISQGGGLKARIAALQNLNLEGPGPGGRPPKPRRKPTASSEDGPISPTAGEGPGELVPDDAKTGAAGEGGTAADVTSPAEPVSSPPVGSPPTMAMPAVPRRAGPPRRKAPAAATPAVEPQPESQPESAPPVETVSQASERSAVPLEADTLHAPRATGHMASDPAAEVESEVNEEELGIASEEPGADLEAEASELGEDRATPVKASKGVSESPASPTVASPPSIPSRLPPPPRRPSSEASSDEEDVEVTEQDNKRMSEPVFEDRSDEAHQFAVVPPFDGTELDEDDINDDEAVLPPPQTSTTSPDGPPKPAAAPMASSDQAAAGTPAPRRSLPSPRGPRAFGSFSGPSQDTGAAAPAVPSASLRPPPIPAPFVRQLTDEPPAAPKIETGRLPPPPPAPASDQEQGEASDMEELASPRGPPSRKMSRVSVEAPTSPIVAPQKEEDEEADEEEQEQEVDPEVARRQALAKRMAAMGGVKIGMVPMFGRPAPPPRQPSQEDSSEVAEAAAKDEPEERPQAPRRIPGLPAGAVPMFGMPAPRPPQPPTPEREEHDAAEADLPTSPSLPEARSPPMPPPNRPAPPPGPRPSSEHETSEEEEAPPPPPRPSGGHMPRGSMEETRPSMDEDRPPPIAPRPTGGHQPRTSMESPRSSVDVQRGSRGASDEASRTVPQRQGSMASSFERTPRSREASTNLPMITPQSPIDLSGGAAFSAEPHDMQAPLPVLPQGAGARRAPPNPAELVEMSERIGASLCAKALRRSKEGTARYEEGVAFVSALISEIPEAAPPPTAGPQGGFGFCLWSSAAQGIDQATMVRSGDVLVTDGALAVKLKGKGLGASSTTLPPGYAAIVVEDYDAKKRKLRVMEVTDKGRIEQTSHHLDGIKSGVLSVYRVLDRSFA